MNTEEKAKLELPKQEATLMETCSKCGRKAYNPSTMKCYRCGAELRKDGSLAVVPPSYIKDENGNVRSTTRYAFKDGRIFVSYDFILEEGKTTLRGEYPKLASPPKCVHPERLDCNYGEGYGRCEFMKHVNGAWTCEARGSS